MTEESKDSEKEESVDSEIKPPMPDVPAAADPLPDLSLESKPEPKPDSAPASHSAQEKMAGEIESGGTPFNYSGALEDSHKVAPKPSSPFSLTNVAALTAVGALILITVVGWQVVQTVSVKIDGVNSNVERLTERLIVESRLARKTGRAVVRAELQKSLKSIEHLIATGDPLLRSEAIRLKNEIREVMAMLSTRADKKSEIDKVDQVESTPETQTVPVTQAVPETLTVPEIRFVPETQTVPEPSADIEAPLSEGVEPDSTYNKEQERFDETQEELADKPL